MGVGEGMNDCMACTVPRHRAHVGVEVGHMQRRVAAYPIGISDGVIVICTNWAAHSFFYIDHHPVLCVCEDFVTRVSKAIIIVQSQRYGW